MADAPPSLTLSKRKRERGRFKCALGRTSPGEEKKKGHPASPSAPISFLHAVACDQIQPQPLTMNLTHMLHGAYCLLLLLLPACCWAECGEYGHLSSAHVMCAPVPERTQCRTMRAGVSESDKELILHAHNAHREQLARGFLKPLLPAADMNKLSWDDELAIVAQKQAELCIDDDSCQSCRAVKRFAVGQVMNVIKTKYPIQTSDWEEMIHRWFEQLKNTPKHLINKYDHKRIKFPYVQVASASTNKIGCGFSSYKKEGELEITNLFVCNYGPAGLQSEHSIYKTGRACSQCSENAKCPIYHSSLCIFDDKARTKREIFPDLGTNFTDPLPTWENVSLPYPELMSCTFNGDCPTKSIGTHPWHLKNDTERGNYFEVTVDRGGNAVLFILNGIPPSPTGNACMTFNYRKSTNGLKSVSLKVFSWSLMGPPIETFIWTDSDKWTEWKTQIPDLKGYAIVLFHVSVPNNEMFHSLTVSVDDIKILTGNCP